jgi:putative DNA methylase
VKQRKREPVGIGHGETIARATTSRVPYEELSVLARHEAHRKSIHRPPYYLHKWWARRTGSVVRGILLDLLLPEGEDVIEAFYRSHDFSGITILDPFMGGGTTLGEALRLGCNAVGSDLNPVAWFLVKRSLGKIDIEAANFAFGEIEARVAAPITAMYATTCSSCTGAATIQHAAWIKQITCRACGDLVDLNLDQVIMRAFGRGGASLVDCPDCRCIFRTHDLDACVDCPECARRFVPRERRCPNTDYRCRCGHEEAILGKRRRLLRPLPHRLRSLSIWCDVCGRVHQAPRQADREHFAEIEREVERRFRSLLIPRARIPTGRNTDQLRRYGYRYWRELFNARQLASLDLLFRAIGQVEDRPSREILLLIASASLEFNSMLCTAKGLGTGAIRQVFTHHAFIPAKAPLEANVWGANLSSGGFSTLYRERLTNAVEWMCQPIERKPCNGKHSERVKIKGEKLTGNLASRFVELSSDSVNLLVLNQSSERLQQIPDGTVDLVVTDPPYADSVMYAELADYFYVWLRLLLKDAYPKSFGAAVINDSREAVHNNGRQRNGDFYAAVVGDVLREAARTLKARGRLAFSFHHGKAAAWRALEVALVRGGFVVERWWPVFAEMESGVPLRGKDNNGQLDIVFICRKADEVRDLTPPESATEFATKLARHLTLVPADYRALAQASAVQRATWERRENT